MATILMDPRPWQPVRAPLFVSTMASPSKAASLALSPISTTTAKQTETPRKLKSQPADTMGSTNNNDDDDATSRPRFQRSDSWSSRTGFSPRPKRSNNPARRPVESASSIRALRLAEQSDDSEKQRCATEPVEDEKFINDSEAASLALSNQCHLERIQEADDSDDETENDSQDDDDDDSDADQYDGDGENDDDDALQLYKSFSGDLVVRYDGLKQGGSRRSHRAYDDDDNDVVRI